MARQPATPAADDPGAERITLTRDELAAEVARAVAAQFALQASAKRPAPTREHLPTEAEAHEQAEALVAEGVPPKGVECQSGWYVHPLVGCSADVIEAHLAKKAKRAAGKKALKAAEDDEG